MILRYKDTPMFQKFKKKITLFILRLLTEAIRERQDHDIISGTQSMLSAYASLKQKEKYDVEHYLEEKELVRKYRETIAHGDPKSEEYAFARMALKGRMFPEVPTLREYREGDGFDPATS